MPSGRVIVLDYFLQTPLTVLYKHCVVDRVHVHMHGRVSKLHSQVGGCLAQLGIVT